MYFISNLHLALRCCLIHVYIIYNLLLNIYTVYIRVLVHIWMYVCTYVFLAFRTQHRTEMTSQKFSNRLWDRPRLRPCPLLLVLLLSTATRHRHTQWKFRSPSFAFALSSCSLLLLAATASSKRATQKKTCQFTLFLTTQQQWIAAFCSFCSNERTLKREGERDWERTAPLPNKFVLLYACALSHLRLAASSLFLLCIAV